MRPLRARSVTLLLAAILAGCGLFEDADGESPSPGPTGGEPGAVQPVPPEVEAAADEWPMMNRDYSNSRATFDAQIDSSNIDQLGLAWSFPITGISDWGGAALNPLVLDGVVYFQDLQSNAYAIDFETGEVIWEREYQRAAIGPNGPAVGWGKLFMQDGVTNLLALDLENGDELWSTEIEPHAGTQQPVAYGGMVYTGTGAGEPSSGPESAGGRESYVGGASGMIYGIEQEAGEIVWEFQVVEEGFWGDPEVNGGGGIWYPPGIDTERELTYWGTGNPAPFPGTVDNPNGGSRPGPNLYTNTLLALGAETGQLDWHHQAKPHDLFDLDYQGSPVLATAEVDGETRDIVIGTGKLGRVIAYDRESGEVLWDTPVGRHQNDDLQEIPPGEEVMVYPGVWGGIETPTAFADGVLYVVTNNLGSPYTATGFDAEEPGEAVTAAEGRTSLEDGHGLLYAVDVDTGAVIWEYEYDVPNFGAATVVNDLVLTATYDGVFHAHLRETGEVVWTLQAPAGVNAWPAVVADTVIWPVGLGPEPQLLALRLGAEGEVPPPEPMEPEESP